MSGEVERWVARLGIKVSNTDNAVRTLSSGNQQRVVLAKWWATEPRVLILDSPTVGVDVSAKDGIYSIVKQLAAEGLAVIMISDEIPEVLFHTHRILVMHAGRITGKFQQQRRCGGARGVHRASATPGLGLSGQSEGTAPCVLP